MHYWERMKKSPPSIWTFPLNFNQHGHFPTERLDSKKISLTKNKIIQICLLDSRQEKSSLSSFCYLPSHRMVGLGWACVNPQNKHMQVPWGRGEGVGQALHMKVGKPSKGKEAFESNWGRNNADRLDYLPIISENHSPAKLNKLKSGKQNNE